LGESTGAGATNVQATRKSLLTMRCGESTGQWSGKNPGLVRGKTLGGSPGGKPGVRGGYERWGPHARKQKSQNGRGGTGDVIHKVMKVTVQAGDLRAKGNIYYLGAGQGVRAGSAFEVDPEMGSQALGTRPKGTKCGGAS